MFALCAVRTLAAALTLLAFTGCVGSAQSMTMRVMMQGAAGATGSIQVEQLEDGQRMVVVELQDVPAPEELTPGAGAFVVWLSPDGASSETAVPVRAGTLRYDRQTHSGTLMSTAPSSRFRVLITTEVDANADQPTGGRVAERTVALN